jgi:hypothetical protein
MKNLTPFFIRVPLPLQACQGVLNPGEFLSRGCSIRVTPEKFSRSIADACEEHGLQVAEFQPRTREQLKAILPKTGTSVNNPVDLGMASVFEVDLYGRAGMCVGLDPGVDALNFQGRGATPGAGHQVCYFVGRGAAKDPETFPGDLFRGLVLGAAISGCSIQGRNPCLSFR